MSDFSFDGLFKNWVTKNAGDLLTSWFIMRYDKEEFIMRRTDTMNRTILA